MSEEKECNFSYRTAEMFDNTVKQINKLAEINSASFSDVVMHCCKYALENYDDMVKKMKAEEAEALSSIKKTNHIV